MWMIDMLILIFILVLLAALICWLLAPRRKTPEGMELLRRYRYAHRGYHDAAQGIPENSLAAFWRAADEGFGAELDVHLSADGRLVVHHDESLLRMCGVEKEIADMTADELAQCRLGGTDEPIPYLEEVLPIFEGKTPLVVEVKPTRRNHAALCKATCEMLDRFDVKYCLESFDPRAVLWLKKNRPELIRGQLSENFTRHGESLSAPTRFLLHNLLGNCATRPDFIAYRIEDHNDLAFRFCTRVLHAQEFGWTIRSREQQSTVEKNGGVIIFELFDPR
jgi:glycerophosphoryl diester phosphodiesterase